MKYNEIMEENIIKDRKRLKESFYKIFDHSMVHTFISGLVERSASSSPESDFLIGEGTYFKVYALKSKVQAPISRMTLSISIAKPNFPPLKTKENRKLWLEALSKLKSLYQEVSLIPPFELLDIEGSLVLAMPFGDTPLDRAALHWQPIKSHVDFLLQKLSTHQLAIEDCVDGIQGRTWQGIPFIFDFSDLRMKS